MKVFGDVKKIYSHFREYRGRVLLISLLVSVYSFLEGFGIATFIPIFSHLTGTDPESQSVITRGVEAIFSSVGVDVSLLTLVGFVVLLISFKCVFQFLSGYLKQHILCRYEQDMESKLFRNLLDVRWNYFIGKKKGHIFDSIVSQVAKSSSLLNNCITFINNIIASACYLAVAFAISVPVTFATLGAGVLAIFLYLPILKRTRRQGEKFVDAKKEINNLLTQFVYAFKEIKLLNVADETSEEFNEQIEDKRQSRVRIKALKLLGRVSLELLAVVIICSLIFVGHEFLQVGLASLVVIAGLFNRIFRKTNNLGEVQSIVRSLPSVEVVSNMLRDFQVYREDLSRDKKPIKFQEQISFENLTFRYPAVREEEKEKDSPFGLTDINVSVRKGEMVGIVGDSGAGKTTFISLFLGLLRYDEGMIRVDDIPLHEADLIQWRQMIGYVPQNSVLINKTIEENISFYRDIEQEQIVEAARMANAHKFISATPDGYRTIAGEEGMKLSGGQRQRIVLARALAGDPEILVLDEATSELDSHSEQKIQESIQSLRDEITIFVVAHRFSTILDSDKIIVLKNGRVVQQGSSPELIEKEGRFKELYEAQTN